MKLINRSKTKNHIFSLSQISGKTAEVAKRSTGFFVYQKLIGFLLCITLGLLLTTVYFSNQLAVSGGFVSVNSAKVESLAKENYQLENKLSEVSSLSYVNSQVDRLGLIKISKIEVLKSSSGVALNQ